MSICLNPKVFAKVSHTQRVGLEIERLVRRINHTSKDNIGILFVVLVLTRVSGENNSKSDATIVFL